MQVYADKVWKSFLWQGGAQITGQIVSWLSTLIVVRLLTPADYGLVSLAMLFVGFFYMLADLGFGASAIQAKELETVQLRELLGLAISANTILAVVTFFGAPLIAVFFHEPRLAAMVRVLAANFLLIAIYSLPQALLMRDLDFRLKARADVAATVTSAVTSLTLAATGFGAWALIGSMLALNTARVVFYYRVRPVLLMPKFSVDAAKPLVHFGALLTIDRVVYYFYGQADIAIGGKVLGSQALGIYTVALTLGSMPLGKIIPVITQVAFAAFSRIQDDLDRVNRNLLRAVHLVSLVAFPALFGLSAVGRDLIPVVLGDSWLAAAVPFQLICLVLPLKAINSIYSPALLGVGRPGVNLVNVGVSSVIMITGFLFGVHYGINGLAMTWVIAYPIAFLVTTGLTARVLRLRISRLFRPMLWPACLSSAMYLMVTAAGQLATGRPVYERLTIMVLLGAITYSTVTWFWNRTSLDDIRLVFNP